ncbi:MAG: HlyD family efflux transporter periplasmic adaptor subunit [Pseudohongiella sp.]|nr:HlyD family efflux transporter periplasmic adaptor subunit [Pseudohongiella sp.]
MRENLFRREVLMVQHDHFFGDPVFYQPLSLRILLLSALACFCVLAGFAAVASIKQTEYVRGFIYAANGEVKVYGSRSGVIQQLRVTNGELVQQGQALATVIKPDYEQSGELANHAILLHLEQQISQIEDRLALSAQRQQLAIEQSQRRQSALREELLIRADEDDLSAQQLQMADDEVIRLEQLRARGAISDSELAQGKSSLVSLRKSFQGTRMAIQTTRRMLHDISHELALEQSRLSDEQIALQINLSQLQQRKQESLYEQQFAITAPVSGRINNLMLASGDQLDPRRPFVSIVADAPAYEAQNFVPSRALGQLRTGQVVLLNYDAFPFQQYGSYEAVVSSIGTAALDPREYLIPLDVSEPVYLIKAELPLDQNVLNLRAGMQFSAQLVTGERTILEGIFEPLTALARRL